MGDSLQQDGPPEAEAQSQDDNGDLLRVENPSTGSGQPRFFRYALQQAMFC